MDVNRPIEVKYNPHDDTIWIVDTGGLEMSVKGVESKKDGVDYIIPN